MWIKLKNNLYNLDRITSIEPENVGSSSYIILYYSKGYKSLHFDDKVERDNVFKKIQELIAQDDCSFFDFDKDNEK